MYCFAAWLNATRTLTHSTRYALPRPRPTPQSSETTDIAFSVMTVTTGIFGTFAGGYVLDLVGNSVRNGMLLGAGAMAAAAVVILVAFLSVSSFLVFCVVFSVGEFFLFFVQAPSNALILWSVPRESRAIAVSLGVVCQHVLGDVPGPPVMGLVQEHLTHNWRATMSLAVVFIALGSVCYGLGVGRDGAPGGVGDPRYEGQRGGGRVMHEDGDEDGDGNEDGGSEGRDEERARLVGNE